MIHLNHLKPVLPQVEAFCRPKPLLSIFVPPQKISMFHQLYGKTNQHAHPPGNGKKNPIGATTEDRSAQPGEKVFPSVTRHGFRTG